MNHRQNFSILPERIFKDDHKKSFLTLKKQVCISFYLQVLLKVVRLHSKKIHKEKGGKHKFYFYINILYFHYQHCISFRMYILCVYRNEWKTKIYMVCY